MMEPYSQIDIIENKFLEPGHSFLECDEDFGIIEKYEKNIFGVYPRRMENLD